MAETFVTRIETPNVAVSISHNGDGRTFNMMIAVQNETSRHFDQVQLNYMTKAQVVELVDVLRRL